MFWKFNTNTTSEIEKLLTKENVTLHEVMDAEDIINECKIQGKALIDFLLKPDMIEELVNLTVNEPSLDLDERIRFKYPNIACELLTSDVPAINERLASDEVLRSKLYSFLENEPPLNPLLASYFSKIIGALIVKKTEQVLDFLKDKDTFISLLLKHIGTSAIMDLMLKIMTQVECVEMKEIMLNWLDSQGVILSLIALLNPKVDKDRHYNVAQLLCDFIRITRDTQKSSTERVSAPNPLLNTLESPETVSVLLDNILEDKCESAIVGGIQVLLVLLDFNKTSIPNYNSPNTYNSDSYEEDNEQQKDEVEEEIIKTIVERLKDFHTILLDPPQKTSINTTVGLLNPPLGNTRVHVTKLFCSILSSNNNELLNEIVSLGTFNVLLDLFFKYPWNNFLHTQVENCLLSALKTHKTTDDEQLNALCRHLLIDCKLIERILDAWKDNDEQQKQSNGLRQGYMGHLISVINKIVDLCSNTSLGDYIKNELPTVWTLFEEFKENTLKETNNIQNTLLGGAYPNSNTQNNDEYGNVEFPHEQLYSNYQMQHLTSHCIDAYSGFNDDAFNDGDDTLQNIDHRNDMNFGIDELIQQHELFKQVCSQNINTLDDADDQIFEDRDHTLQTVIEKGDRNETICSSDSDEDSPSNIPMETDPWSSPKNNPNSLDLNDPWGGIDSNNPNDTDFGGWADFSSASFDSNFNRSFPPPVENDLKIEKIDENESKTSINIAQKEQEKQQIELDKVQAASGDQLINKVDDKNFDDTMNVENEPSTKSKNNELLEDKNKIENSDDKTCLASVTLKSSSAEITFSLPNIEITSGKKDV